MKIVEATAVQRPSELQNERTLYFVRMFAHTKIMITFAINNNKQHKDDILMKTTIEERDGKYIATLEGELNTAAALETEEIMRPLYNSGGKDVIVDCTKLAYIASSGLRILLGILKGAKANGSNVILRNVNDDIKNVFRMTGFIQLFVFE